MTRSDNLPGGASRARTTWLFAHTAGPSSASTIAIASGWRMNMPRILTGWLPDGQAARRQATDVKSGTIRDWDGFYQQIDAEIKRKNAERPF
jgi:hypothetical protein